MSADAADSSSSRGPSQPQTAPRLSDDSTQTDSVPNPIKAPFSLGQLPHNFVGCSCLRIAFSLRQLLLHGRNAIEINQSLLVKFCTTSSCLAVQLHWLLLELLAQHFALHFSMTFTFCLNQIAGCDSMHNSIVLQCWPTIFPYMFHPALTICKLLCCV